MDWADRTHVGALGRPDGPAREIVRVGAAPEVFGAWLETVERQYPAGDLVVAVERSDGAAVTMRRARPRWCGNGGTGSMRAPSSWSRWARS